MDLREPGQPDVSYNRHRPGDQRTWNRRRRRATYVGGLQYSTVGNVFRKLTTRRRRQRLLALATLFILIAGPYIVSRVRSAGRQIRVRSGKVDQELSTEPVTRIRVLTYNIAHGRGAADDNWERVRLLRNAGGLKK